MPQGLEGIRQEANRINERKNQFAQGKAEPTLFFKLKEDGDSAVVRFLEDGEDINYAYCWEVHTAERKWPTFVPCIDQNGEGLPDPGAEHELPRKFKGWINIIWRDAPEFATDENGRLNRDVVVGHKDQVAVWNQGIQVFQNLADKAIAYKGLSSRDFRITRRGTGLNTQYQIDPADPDSGPVALTSEDQALADSKNDLSRYVTPPTYDELEALITGKNNGGVQQADISVKSPFTDSSDSEDRANIFTS